MNLDKFLEQFENFVEVVGREGTAILSIATVMYLIIHLAILMGR